VNDVSFGRTDLRAAGWEDGLAEFNSLAGTNFLIEELSGVAGDNSDVVKRLREMAVAWRRSLP
jgi:hypothetical protein